MLSFISDAFSFSLGNADSLPSERFNGGISGGSASTTTTTTKANKNPALKSTGGSALRQCVRIRHMHSMVPITNYGPSGKWTKRPALVTRQKRLLSHLSPHLVVEVPFKAQQGVVIIHAVFIERVHTMTPGQVHTITICSVVGTWKVLE